MKKIIYILCAVAVIGLVAVRVSAIGSEKHQYVFNAAREAVDRGMPIESVVATTTSGVLRTPVHIQGNRGYVAFSRLGKFAKGQKIGGGEIISVSDSIDLDTGLYAVRTKNVKNGLHMAEKQMHGIFIPRIAVIGDTVFVARDDVAHAQKIEIIDADDEFAIVDGLAENDVVILSAVSDGQKIKVK